MFSLVSSGVLFVVAKAAGRTSVAALDADSELVGEWTIATVLDIQPARAALEGVSALKNVVVRQLNRGVELSGTVTSIAAADMALRLATTALPEETPVENRISVTGKQQVNLEVQIAEVQRNVSETLGFNWEVVPDIGGGRLLGFQVGRFLFDEATGQIPRAELLPEGQAAALTGSTGVSPGRTTVRGLIDALASAGLATVLARPNVTAVSGETASFFSGGEYPLPSGFEDGAIIFEYKKYGVLLDFVPTIIDSGRIMLTVRPEVSQRSDTDSLRVTGIDIPVINVRRAETTVEVGDGESIVIAGLYRDQSEAVEAGLPVVKDIPLLGMFFGSQSVRSNATELIVVVTARLTTATTMPRTTDRDRQLPGRLRGYHYSPFARLSRGGIITEATPPGGEKTPMSMAGVPSPKRNPFTLSPPAGLSPRILCAGCAAGCRRSAPDARGAAIALKPCRPPAWRCPALKERSAVWTTPERIMRTVWKQLRQSDRSRPMGRPTEPIGVGRRTKCASCRTCRKPSLSGVVTPRGRGNAVHGSDRYQQYPGFCG